MHIRHLPQCLILSDHLLNISFYVNIHLLAVYNTYLPLPQHAFIKDELPLPYCFPVPSSAQFLFWPKFPNLPPSFLNKNSSTTEESDIFLYTKDTKFILISSL